MPFNHFFHHLTLMGIVTEIDHDAHNFTILLGNGQHQVVFVGKATTFEVVKNLDNVSRDRFLEVQGDGDDRSKSIRKYLWKGAMVAMLGVYSEDAGNTRYDARNIYLMHQAQNGKFLFEETHWWITQISLLADQWLDQLFGDRRDYTAADFAALYRTNLNIIGLPTDDNTQEMATLSRLLYGLSSAYLLTGSERYLRAARAGIQYQHDTFRFLNGPYCFWASARKRERYITRLYEVSQNGDDLSTIPLYEQIYALAGLTQYYRITLDWRILEDIRRTVRAFNDFFLDGRTTDPNAQGGQTEPNGYFTHLDYVTMRPDVDALGENKSRKNWNSIGDHIPAYLLNLLLALDPLPEGHNTTDLVEFVDKCKWMLDHVTTLICTKFPPEDGSPYVNERYFQDWRPDHEWSWQQNRAIVGHNLKIAWNLTRVAGYYRKQAREDPDGPWTEKANRCLAVARRLADAMAEVGVDQIRGGCFDAVERLPENGMPIEFAWSSTKDFWQQEQGILAYLILSGAANTQESQQKYELIARKMMAFWNLFFLDHDYNGIFFRTSDDGIPITSGSYGIKGGHAISGYHSFELNFLAHIYIRTFINPVEEHNQETHFVLYFKPDSDCQQRSINVLPDFFAPGKLRLESVTVGGRLRDGALPSDFRIELNSEELGRMITAEFRSHPKGLD